ncbi:MAG TPA: OmpA family protein [Anaeromyxobacteraceae bacterium]|nr:OmpA family protein [Anaeromyxobacteraceae bacterium]
MDTYDDVLKEAVKLARPSRTPWILFVLALAAGGGAAFWLLQRLDRARSDFAASQSQLVDARTQLDRARTERAELDQRLEKMESEKADLLALKNDLSRDVQAKEEELAKLKGTYDELQDKMKAEIAKGDVRLSQSGGRIKVDLVDQILFDVGDASVAKRGEEVLSRVGAVLARSEDKQIQVSGHTDDSPISKRLEERYPTNWELSAARAINVVRFLQDSAKIPGRRLVAAAHSQYEPISTNANPSGRQRNRRIEILLAPALEPTPAKAAASGKATAASASAAKGAAKPPVKKAAAKKR